MKAFRKSAEKLVEETVRQLEPLRPRSVILFGSYSRGDQTETSDIDLCVISDQLPEDEVKRRTVSGLYNVPRVRCMGFYSSEFLDFLRKLKFLAFDIVYDGRTITDDGFFLEAKKLSQELAAKYEIQRKGRTWRWNRDKVAGQD